MNASTSTFNPVISSQAPPMYSSPDDKERLYDRINLATNRYHPGPPVPQQPHQPLHHTRSRTRLTIYFTDPRFNFFNMHSGHIILFARRQWPSAEHLYQALKFAEPRIRRKIRHAETPLEARELAQKFSPFMKPNWPDLRLDYARAVVALKTAQHPDIAVALLATGDDRLVNDTSHPFWGAPASGQNQLGRIWIEERARLSLEVRLQRPNMVNLMVAVRKDLEE